MAGQHSLRGVVMSVNAEQIGNLILGLGGKIPQRRRRADRKNVHQHGVAVGNVKVIVLEGQFVRTDHVEGYSPPSCSSPSPALSSRCAASRSCRASERRARNAGNSYFSLPIGGSGRPIQVMAFSSQSSRSFFMGCLLQVDLPDHDAGFDPCASRPAVANFGVFAAARRFVELVGLGDTQWAWRR